MTPTWPPPLAHQVVVRAAGFTFHGHHGRFAFAYRQRGPVAIVEYFVVHPQLRDMRYVRIAFNDVAAFLYERGVRYVVAWSTKLARLWRRLGMTETEPSWLLLRMT